MSEMVRFLSAAAAGLLLDIAVAWSAACLLGLPLWLAAAVGFVVAAAANYAAHEVWTFRDGARRLSAGRALRYGAAVAGTLGARIVTVAALVALVEDGYALSVLLAGAAVSFFVNYASSKYFVFRRDFEAGDTAP